MEKIEYILLMALVIVLASMFILGDLHGSTKGMYKVLEETKSCVEDYEIPEMSMTFTVKNSTCPEDGCILTHTLMWEEDNESVRNDFNYTLNYTLWRRTDNCGLDERYYWKLLGKYYVHEYVEHDLINYYETDEPCIREITGIKGIGIWSTCDEMHDDIVVETINKPKRYAGYEDCE